MADKSFILQVVLLCVGLVAFILTAAATGSNNWSEMSHSSSPITYHGGLWVTCAGSSCSSIKDAEDWVKACQAFTIFSCLVLPAALVVIVVKLLKPQLASKMLSMLVVLCLFLSTLFMLIALAVFHGEIDTPSGQSFQWGLFLGWIGFVLQAACFVLSIVLQMQESNKVNIMA